MDLLPREKGIANILSAGHLLWGRAIARNVSSPSLTAFQSPRSTFHNPVFHRTRQPTSSLRASYTQTFSVVSPSSLGSPCSLSGPPEFTPLSASPGDAWNFDKKNKWINWQVNRNPSSCHPTRKKFTLLCPLLFFISGASMGGNTLEHPQNSSNVKKERKATRQEAPRIQEITLAHCFTNCHNCSTDVRIFYVSHGGVFNPM